MEVDDTAVPVEEAPAEAPPAISSSSSSSNAQGSVSSEYLEAFQGIQSDPYDTTSWNILLEEVEKGNGGTASVVETFSRFLKQFPRAARVYGRLAEHHVKTNNAAAAEELLCKEVGKLRHVDLWMQYLKIMKRQVSGDRGGTATAKDKADQQHLARRAYESAFDRALDNVGYSIESGPIWKDYIDFLRDYPEAQMDPAKKMAAIRKAYQRALCVPMDNLDTLWRDYEGYERMLSEHAAKEILPDVQNKYLSAKALYRERKRMVGRIFFDRQAVPSSRSRQELEQLDLWNKWIRYEKGNPDNLSSENLKGAMQMVYEQCLCCMRFHPEVWLSLAKFKMGVGQAGSIEEARAVFDEAIETLPNVAFLRIAYSEVEEHHGSMDKARDILDAAFGHLPSGLTFSVLQRFTRRRDGIVAARKFFSDTLPMRIDKKLGYEVYISHAQLELDVNCLPEVAHRVLELARAAYPTETCTVQYVRLLVRVLLRLGDLNKIRWAFQTVLGEGGAAAVTSVAAAAIGVKGGGAAEGSAAGTSVNAVASPLSMREQLELWEDYLTAETILGLSSVHRLDELRGFRDGCRAAFEDGERAKNVTLGSAAIAAAESASAAKPDGVFDASNELLDRYGGISSAIPEADLALSERSRGFNRNALGAPNATGATVSSRPRKWGSVVGADGNKDAAAEADSSGVTLALRHFINRLPPHTGPLPDFDTFSRHLRSLVLPPRPVDESEAQMATHTKRSAPGQDWLAMVNDEDDAAGDDMTSATRDDIFRARQRARLG